MSTLSHTATPTAIADSITEFHGVRYLVSDVQRAVDFYTSRLGFSVDHEHLPEFATIAMDALKLHLSGPGASGSRPLRGTDPQRPGGSNRVVLRVTGLADLIEALREQGVTFRNDLETGPAGSQIQVEDPDGNPIELFEPARRS